MSKLFAVFGEEETLSALTFADPNPDPEPDPDPEPEPGPDEEPDDSFR